MDTFLGITPATGLKSLIKNLTMWNVVLVLAHKVTAKYVNLLFLSGVVMCLALWISYVKPGYLKYVSGGKAWRIVGWPKLVIDLIFHVAPFVFVALTYGRYYARKGVLWALPTSNALLILTIYIVAFNPAHVYDVDQYFCVVVLVVLVLALVQMSMQEK